jgi:flagellar hook-associated protein 3 FlgL
MRVTFNKEFRDSADAIARNAAELSARQREVSSGRRIHSPSDDPSGTAAAIAERAEMATTDRYRQAADSVVSRLSVVDTALSELSDQTSAARVSVMSARGSTVSATQREAAAKRLEGVRDAVLSAMNTKFRGTYLFAGNEGSTRPYDRIGDAISAYQGGDDAIAVDIDRQLAVGVGLAGSGIMQGGDSEDLFAVLDGLIAAARSNDGSAMESGISGLDRAATRIASAQMRVGTDLADVDVHTQQLDTRRLASLSRLSSLEDVNLAQSISAMTKAETAYRAALGAVNSTQQLSLLDYLK